MSMPPSDTASARPTPEAILGVLGKLRRTLSRDVAQQSQTPDKSGLIKAADMPTSAPNLLRPSPGLESLLSKQGLPSERSLNMAGLESAAPPVELDRSSKPQTGRPVSESAPGLSLPAAAVPGPDLSENARASSVLPETAISGSALADVAPPATAAPNRAAVASALPDKAVADPPPSTQTISTVTQTAEGTQSGGVSGIAAASSSPTVEPSAGFPYSSSSNTVTEGTGLRKRNESAADANTQSSSTRQPASVVTGVAHRMTSGDVGSGFFQDPEAVLSDPETVSSSPEAVSPDIKTAEQAAELDKDLDAVIDELALEVSNLQPAGAEAKQAQQGSYLQRHTSSIVLKIAQEASTPPLPAVATMAQPKAGGPAQPVPARHAGKSAEAQQAKQALKSMAASLKRAYDEGRLKERHPAPKEPTGDEQASSGASAAVLRSYRPSSKTMKDYNPPPVQHKPSPNLSAAASSYAALTASMRRSISPRAAAHALPLDKRPAWDASPPPRRSPQHAQQASDLGAALADQVVRQHSSAAAQHAEREVGEISHLKVSSQLPKALTSAESAALAVAALLHESKSGRQTASSIRQTLPSPCLTRQAMQPSALTHLLPTAGTPSMPSMTYSSNTAGGNSVPFYPIKNNALSLSLSYPRAARTNNGPEQGLMQPAWVSPSQRRRTSSSQQPSPLRRSTGSRTLTPQKVTTDRLVPTPWSQDPSNAARAASHGLVQGLAAARASADVPAQHSALLSDAAELDIAARSPSLADSLQADAHSLAHAQALQRLQQAVQEYKSSSANVLVPASVQLAAALRRASRASGEPLQTIEALQLAGLKLKHEAGLDSAEEHVPKSPWPDWVRGAWGSPHAPSRGPPRAPVQNNQQSQFEFAQGAQRAKSKAAASLRVPAAQAKQTSQYKTAEQAKQAASSQAGLQAALEPVADQQTPVADWSPVKAPVAQPSRRTTLVQRALSEAAAAAAVARAAPKPKSRTTTAPPRRAGPPKQGTQTNFAPPRRPVPQQQPALPQQAIRKRPVPGQTPPARHAVPSNQATQGSTSPAAKSLIVNKDVAARQPKVHVKAKVVQQPAGTAAAPQVEREAALPAMHAVPDSAAEVPAMHAAPEPVAAGSNATKQETAVPSATETSASDDHTTSPHAVASDAHSSQAAGTGSMPTHSSTSVAALRKTFEQKAGLVDEIKPKNRLPLRKVSSKAHVMPGDNASPQEAALKWQQSLRYEHDPQDSQHPPPHAVPAARHHPISNHANQAKHSRQEQGDLAVADSSCNVASGSTTGLMHTMSALVSQREESNLAFQREDSSLVPQPEGSSLASQREQSSSTGLSQHVGAAQSPLQSPAQQVPALRLTEASLTAADAAWSSAEKLQSHRLTITHSTFNSDQGSLFSMESDVEEEEDRDAVRVSSPAGIVSHPLFEEATLALLPDSMALSSVGTAQYWPVFQETVQTDTYINPQGMSPVSEATEEELSTEGRAVSWRGMRWAHGPSWVRVVCRLTPSPTPHFAHPQGPHILQANLGRHGADAKQYTFDQVLTEDSSCSEVAAEAEGLVQAVLQGHNSVVLALGQSGSGKTHTMAGDIAPLDRTRTRTTGLSQALVDRLFYQIHQGQQPAQVHSVYMTAFQIQDERIQDLLQAQPSISSARQLQRKDSMADKHDVFVDKEKRTWVSNLAAIQIMSSSDFSDIAELIASRRSSSSSAHSLSHGPSSCIITLLVTADLPSAPASHVNPPGCARGQKANSSAAASDSLGRHGSPSGQGGLQRGAETADVHSISRRCIKLSLVEVGCANSPSANNCSSRGARRVSAEPLQQTQLSRTSTTLSSFRPMGSTASSRWAVASGGAGSRKGGAGAVNGQDISMRAVAEVVWAAAHGKGVPVPHRQCKLTRYLQDTLNPSDPQLHAATEVPAVTARQAVTALSSCIKPRQLLALPKADLQRSQTARK